ncbi:hypothetical protein BJY52DRAFT_112064 [Lactarius psammicola]|nr:hypothetical protein BJY52DRAFT_112064 [Lactarius psammicola]
MSLPGSIITTPTTPTPASSTSSSVPPSTTPSLIFVGIDEMFTCGISPIRWGYSGPAVPMSLNITNLNVPQQAPLSTSSIETSTSNGTTPTTTPVIQPGVKRQFSGYGGSYLPDINEQLVTQWDPTINNWTWPAVNVPQGWYQLLATVQGAPQTTSSTFFVQNGTNVDCIPQFASSSSTTSPVPVPTDASPSPVVGASSGHSHAGAIAGGVIGGIAFFAAALVAFLFWFLRRRSDHSRRGDENGRTRRWSAMALKRSRHASGGASSTRKDPPGLPALEPDQTFIGSDEELSTVGHEKVNSTISPTILPYHPSHPQSRRASTQTTGSYGRAMSNPEPPLRPPSYQPHVGEVFPLERAQTAGCGPRRKPAPRYDEEGDTAAERNGACSSRTTLDSTHGNNNDQSHSNDNGNSDGTHVLQHQSSFGAMRPMHVIIPDPPPPART